MTLVEPIKHDAKAARWIGIFLLIAGSFGKGILLALAGILSVVAGGYMISQPVAAFGDRPANGGAIKEALAQ